MKYVPSLQGGQTLEVPSSEYDVVGSAFDVSWPLETLPGTPLVYRETDITYAPLALDSLENPTSRSKFAISERVPATRGLSKILTDASLLEAYKSLHTAQARFSTAELPEGQKQLLGEAEVWANTTVTAEELRIYRDGKVMDIVDRGKVVLAPWAAKTALGGLRSIARTHGISGAVRRMRDPYKLPVREDRTIRRAAIKILQDLAVG
jgi:hypothetical protein